MGTLVVIAGDKLLRYRGGDFVLGVSPRDVQAPSLAQLWGLSFYVGPARMPGHDTESLRGGQYQGDVACSDSCICTCH